MPYHNVLLVINKYVSSDDVYVSILYVQVGCHSQKNNVGDESEI